ncbi:glycosyltransferase family 1 protein [Phaeovulum sp. NW3]|uniref:glycosyltransferase family 4 protein n=1 Tax=Phaeovulum sp. NW3 TaxID=2934933 RepID=UPI0020203704|nr:glycosyltransferase family 1 protein [Phaeovulum sp. NW3]MCL7465437.1 glycosyltransferase family 4 protein [Phaeovulum sp. NW3]
MGARPASRLLDITRLVSRVGQGPLTGVDRVEAAYLRALRAAPVPLYLLCRTAYGFLLLPGATAEFLFAGLSAPDTLPRAGLIDRLRGRGGPRPRLEAGLRARALARAPHARLAALVGRNLPAPVSYINVGQTTARPNTLARLKRVPGLHIAVMIHDTIPLDFPQFASRSEPERFRAAFDAVLAHADLVICNSNATAADVRRHARGRTPPLLVAHLGLDVPQPAPDLVPADLDLLPQYFVTIGTIEPRKNHALLLDVWEDLLTRMPADQAPRLLVLGRRGWRNQALFERLDTAPYMGRVVHELPDLPDGAVASLLTGARALLAPSLAEGFGLPTLEAAALGTAVIATPLPATKELLGAAAIYPESPDRYAWGAELLRMISQGPQDQPDHGTIVVPSWEDHFNKVFTLI